MRKILRIRPAWGNIVICIALSVAFFVYGYITDNSKFTTVFGLFLICFVIYALFFWIDFGPDEIIVNYFFIRRRISIHRISSIEVARLRSGYNLIICIDGHSPYISKDNNRSLIQRFCNPWRKRFFWLSVRVIAIQLPYLKCNEYIKVLSELYGNVTLEKRYMDFQTKLDQAIIQNEENEP